MEILLIILISLILIMGYVIFNLLRKIETAEDMVVGYLVYLDKISKIIEISDEKLKKLDYKGSFKSDDEIGFFFEQVKRIQEVLNEFQVKNIK